LTRKKKLEEEEEERNPRQKEERKNPKQKRSNKHKSPTHTQQKQVYISTCMRVAKLTKSYSKTSITIWTLELPFFLSSLTPSFSPSRPPHPHPKTKTKTTKTTKKNN
jgi:Na+/glutamate symporter